MFKSPLDFYKNRKKQFEVYLKDKQKSIKLITNLRLLVFILGIFLILYFYTNNYRLLGRLTLFLGILGFILLIIRHEHLKSKKRYIESIIKINERGTNRINGNWVDLNDGGSEFIDKNHRNSYDLDIFGKASVFQWLNNTRTYTGRSKLKELLTYPNKDINLICKKQESIKELSEKIEWIQNFTAEGTSHDLTKISPEEFLDWANKINNFYLNKLFNIIIKILPVITAISLILYIISPDISFIYFIIFYSIQLIILVFPNKTRTKSLNQVSHYLKHIKSYRGMLKRIELESFDSNFLTEIAKNLKNDRDTKGYKQIDMLINIGDSISNRNNMFFFLINVFLLWDYQCMVNLEKWKKRSGSKLKQWLDSIGEIEVLNSFAIIYFENPDWIMPEVLQTPNTFESEKIGHPLIKDRVCNDLSLDYKTRILLITGSNMSGKSTLLRTVGVNLVFAYAGGPVCAKKFSCSVMELYSCMRINDSLKENISSFYAELLKIKKIIEAAKNKENVFCLLDEIFKGTNSKDRNIGAKILINKLINEKVLGLISTHDLELGNMEKLSDGKIKNYNFREFFKNNEIYFDYKLRKGISKTTNALYLMKIAGVYET